jgi:hypothetical protein
MRVVRVLGALAVICLALNQDPVLAQTTRAEEAQSKRQAKEAAKKPYKRKAIEAALFKIEDSLLIERWLMPPRGFHLRLGGVQEGSGLGAGPGYRYIGDSFEVRASAAGSLKKYFIAEGAVRFPGTRQDSLFSIRDGAFVEIYARRRDFPQEDFFGLGPDSLKENRSDYTVRDTFARVTPGYRVGRKLGVGVNVGYLDPTTGPGKDTRMPSSTDVFAPGTTPGLDEPLPTFTVVEPYVEITTIDRQYNEMTGGKYRFSFSRYNDRDLDRFSFRRWDVDLRQYIGFFESSRTLALRAFASSAEADDANEVPFYLQPTLGGAYTLRGFRAFRFRDESALLLQAEYRWRINELIAGALFYDTGAVARRLGDLGKLERDYGIGMRVGGRNGVNFRADLAFGGSDGMRLLLRFDDVF